VVESLVVMDIDDMLDMDDLSPDLLDGQSIPLDATSPSTSSGITILDEGSSELIGKSMKEIERWATEQTLKLANQNRKETARILGISERNLYRLIQKYGLKNIDDENPADAKAVAQDDASEDG
jgi:two-component system response regulator HydG